MKIIDSIPAKFQARGGIAGAIPIDLTYSFVLLPSGASLDDNDQP